jgi:hypothetical protein
MEKTVEENPIQRSSSLVPLRAHHLHVLLGASALGADHNPKLRDWVRRYIATSAFGLRKNPDSRRNDEFANILVDTFVEIITGEVEEVLITNNFDYICDRCPAREENQCNVIRAMGFNEEVITVLDNSIAANTKGVIEIGMKYSSKYLMSKRWEIRLALLRTIFQIKGIMNSCAT